MAKKLDLVTLRTTTGLNQTDFWGPIGVTQSGGARYEMGRRLPKPVQELLRLRYIEKIDLSSIKRADMDIIAFLKAQQPKEYERLKKAAAEFFKGR